MAEKALADLTIKELTDRLKAIDKERADIVTLIQDAANAVGVVHFQQEAVPKQTRSKAGKSSNKEAVQAILAGGKSLPTDQLVKEMTARTGGKESSAKQFLYGKVGKKALTLADGVWKLKG